MYRMVNDMERIYYIYLYLHFIKTSTVHVSLEWVAIRLYRKNSLDSALIIIFWGWAITLNDILIIIFAPGRYVHLFTRISQGCLG